MSLFNPRIPKLILALWISRIIMIGLLFLMTTLSLMPLNLSPQFWQIIFLASSVYVHPGFQLSFLVTIPVTIHNVTFAVWANGKCYLVVYMLVWVNGECSTQGWRPWLEDLGAEANKIQEETKVVFKWWRRGMDNNGAGAIKTRAWTEDVRLTVNQCWMQIR